MQPMTATKAVTASTAKDLLKCEQEAFRPDGTKAFKSLRQTEIASRIPYVQGSANQNRSFFFHHPAGKGGLSWAVPAHGLPVLGEKKVQ